MATLRVLETVVDPRSRSYLAARANAMGALEPLDVALEAARDSGGEKAVTRHHARGRLLARERIELLVDRDSPLLELSPVAGWGTGAPVGAGAVIGLGVVTDRICVLAATEPTVRGGAGCPQTLRKLRRAVEIAAVNRLPLLLLTEPLDRAEPTDHGEPTASEVDAPLSGQAGEFDRQLAGLGADLARLTAAGVPTVGVRFAGGLPGGTDLAGWCDPLVTLDRPAALERVEYVAADERDALRLVRQCLRRLPLPDPPVGPSPVRPAPPDPPKYDIEELLGVPIREPRELLARILDGSRFDESQPGHGDGVCTGWGTVHRHRVAVLADDAGVAGEAAAGKALRLLARAAAARVPVVLLANGSAVADSALSVAVAHADLPLILLRVGDWPASSATAALARFRFAWATAESALTRSGRLADDGVIDPRDTRTVLGFCLAVVSAAQRWGPA